MPRASAEARAASAYQNESSQLPQPPKALAEPERAIWRHIVRSKPVGWFNPGALILLEQYCGTAVEAQSVMAELRIAPLDDKRGLRKELIRLNTSLATLATKLRLSVQAAVDRRSKMLDETNDEKAEDKLLGGKAVWAGAKLRAVS